MEKAGYIFLAIVAIIWFLFLLTGLILAFPFGIIGMIAIVGIGLLIIKVLKERLENKEDNHYDKNIHR